MKLTEGHYDLESGYLYIHQYEVEEKPKTYKSVGNSLFHKEDEEYVHLIKGSDTRCPRLEVFTLDTKNPVGKIQSLVGDWMENRRNMVPFKTKIKGEWQFDKNTIREYMESINLEAFNLSDVEFPTKEDVELVYLHLKTMDNPNFYHLKSEVFDLLQDMQEEISLDEVGER